MTDHREMAREWLRRVMGPRYHESHGDSLAALLDRAAELEREACAKVADNPYSDAVGCSGRDEPSEVGAFIAAAIRARGGSK